MGQESITWLIYLLKGLHWGKKKKRLLKIPKHSLHWNGTLAEAERQVRGSSRIPGERDEGGGSGRDEVNGFRTSSYH